MTTDCEVISENATTQYKMRKIPAEILDIIIDLAKNKDIVFKSIQIDDPDVEENEKKQIAGDIFIRDQSMFLLRFGRYLNEGQLKEFERFVVQALIHDSYKLEETQLVIEDLKQKLYSRRMSIKNRRYVALQGLLKKGEYFSEHEMMQRSPELYQELVGQHLSEEEIKIRDGYDVRNTTFSGILMHTLEQKEREKVLQKAMKKLQNKEKQEYNNQTRTVVGEVPSSYQHQWGGFDDEQIACSKSIIRKEDTMVKDNNFSMNHKPSTSAPVNAGERELLRQEFIALMYEQFLSGEDPDFDYSTVDDNVCLDDLKQYSQDREDAYFEGGDDSDEDHNHLQNRKETQTMAEESEDELEIYMRHLQNHHSLQN